MAGTDVVARLLSGRRAGAILILGGVVLAALAVLLVRNVSNRAAVEAAAKAQPVYVVMATQDIPEMTPIAEGAVAIKAFPAAFAPPGAVTRVEDAVGKQATARITRDQVVLTSQVATAAALRSGPSQGIPAGKVAFWMPVPDLLGQSGGLQTGDHVDILLTITLTGAGTNPTKGLTTQSTVQNAQVLFVGPAVVEPPASQPVVAQAAPTPNPVSKPGAKVMAVLITPQDAVVAKYIKDSGGTIDLVLRSRDWQEIVTTEQVNADALVDRFRFRVPDRWTASK